LGEKVVNSVNISTTMTHRIDAVLLLVLLVHACLPIASNAYLATCDGVPKVATGDTVDGIIEQMEACYAAEGKVCIEVTGSELEEISNACTQFGRYQAGWANYFNVATFCAVNHGYCWRASYSPRVGNGRSDATTDVYKTCADYVPGEMMYKALYDAATATCLTTDMLPVDCESTALCKTQGGDLLRQIQRGLLTMRNKGTSRVVATPRVAGARSGTARLTGRG